MAETKDTSTLADEQLTPEQLKKRIANRKKREAQRAKKESAPSKTPAKNNAKQNQKVQDKPSKAQVAKNSPTILALENLLAYAYETETNEKLGRFQESLYRNRSGVIRALNNAMVHEPDSFVKATVSEYGVIGQMGTMATELNEVLGNIAYKKDLFKRRRNIGSEDQKEAADLLALEFKFLSEINKVNDALSALIDESLAHKVAPRYRQKLADQTEKEAKDGAVQQKTDVGDTEASAAKKTTVAAKSA